MDISKLNLDIYFENMLFFTSDNLVSSFNPQIKLAPNIQQLYFAIVANSSGYEKKLVICLLLKEFINTKCLQNDPIANVQHAETANPGHFKPITKSANHLTTLLKDL